MDKALKAKHLTQAAAELAIIAQALTWSRRQHLLSTLPASDPTYRATRDATQAALAHLLIQCERFDANFPAYYPRTVGRD